MLVLGIDEAGRGAVLGPLVVCGCALEPGRLGALAALGVKDSKVLQPSARRRLNRAIRGFGVRLVIRRFSARRVDAAVRRGGLNALEVDAMAGMLKELNPATAYVDALTTRAARFGRRLEALAGGGVKVVSEHRADARYPIVQAASIVAKVARDAAIERLRSRAGEIGSGYPSDPATRRYLSRIIGRGPLPRWVRASWSTLSGLGAEKA